MERENMNSFKRDKIKTYIAMYTNSEIGIQ